MLLLLVLVPLLVVVLAIVVVVVVFSAHFATGFKCKFRRRRRTKCDLQINEMNL